MRRWSAEELCWGRDCYAAGDSLEEVMEAAACSREEVLANIGPGRLTPVQREVVSLYNAGCTFAEIDRERGVVSRHPGKAAASMITTLRRGGFHLPYRNEVEAEARAGAAA